MPAGAEPAFSMDAGPLSTKVRSDDVDDALLDAPLATVLYVNTRLENAIIELGLQTVRDLVRLRPADLLGVRSVGRQTLKEAEKVIREHLGVTWAEARAALVSPPAPALDLCRLDAPLAILNPPTKLARVIDRLQLFTVRDLVVRTPTDLLRVSYAGKVTVRQAEDAIQSYLGVAWTEARTSAAHLPWTPRPPWQTLRARVPERVLEMDVGALPERIAAICRCQWSGTVRGLLGNSPEAMRAQRALEPGWMELAEALTSIPPDPLDVHSHWLDLFRGLTGELRPRERWVIERRSGLAGEPGSFEDLAQRLDISKQRVQQIEARALRAMRGRGLWTSIVAQKVDAALAGWLRPVSELGERDVLFMVDARDAVAFTFFVNILVGGRVTILHVSGELLASRLGERAVRHLIRKVRSAAESLPFPMTESEVEAALVARFGWDAELVRDLIQRFEAEFLREGPLLMGLGERPSVATVLRASSIPLDVRSIWKRCGRRADVPNGVVAISHGVLTLPEKLPGWHDWSDRLGPLCRGILEEGDPRRQWTTTELLRVLRQRTDLPEWINEWSLGSVLRGRSEVRWLGRNVVTLPNEARIDVRLAAIQILERHGRPMKLETLGRRVQARRGCSLLSVRQLQYETPFIVLEDRRIGLSLRDVPDGKRTLERIIRSAMFRLRSKRQVRVRDVATTLGLDHRLVGSLLRQDERFSFAHGGVVRLVDGSPASLAGVRRRHAGRAHRK